MKIKVRVWDGEQMISPDYIDRDGIAHWKADSIPRLSDKVMMFTGLLDKNGKEIYEGDLLRWFDVDTETGEVGNEISEVVFHQGSWSRKVRDLIEPIIDAWGEDNPDVIETEEIIGNIHESPYLLDPAPEIKTN